MNEPTASQRPRILLADDHQLMLQRVRSLVETLFEVVGTAHDGQKMVSEALRLQPDAIVADISMPGLSGIEAARQLRQQGCTAKLVFLTIHSEDEFLDACLAEGAMGYVVKAHMKTDLIPAINDALSGRCSFRRASGR
jgi:DNA-binding NarL/FixJ family response regulator